MTYFWIGLAVVLIVAGLFVITQGGSQVGGTLALLGVVIGLVLVICPARAQGFRGADDSEARCCADRNHDGYHLKHASNLGINTALIQPRDTTVFGC
jgi:hypothetical protein